VFKVFDCMHGVSNPDLSLAQRDPSMSLSLDAWLDDVVPQHLARMDAGGVDHAAINASVVYRRTEGIAATRRQNDYVAQYRDRAMGRLPAAMGVAEPLYAEDSLAEIDRCKRELNLTGIIFHPRFQGASLESYWILRYVERILSNGMTPVICGMGETVEEALWKVAYVAKTFKDSEFLVAVALSTWENASQAYTVSDECPNLSWDTSLTYEFDMIEPFIEVAGSRRVVFGTDLHHPPPPKPDRNAPRDRFVRLGGMVPPMHISHVKDQLIASALSDEQKQDVLWNNAQRLFRLD
jgi:predicted TIM-barrel fold metal-dependent hydrolase